MKTLKLIAFTLLAAAWLGACAPPGPVMKTSAQVLAEIEPGFHVAQPAGAGPHPVVLVLHGASDKSWYPVYQEILDRFAQAGYAAVFVDSYTGRNVNGPALRSGAMLPGERAADLLAALDWTRGQPWADGKRIAAVGYSHGAATILDSLVLAPPGPGATGLKDVPAGGLDGLKAGVLYYPWCSGPVMGLELMKAVKNDWSAPVPILAFVPDKDRDSDVKLCTQILERHAAKGLPVEIVHYPNAGHTFSQAVDDHGNAVATYDAEAAADAERRMMDFLEARF